MEDQTDTDPAAALRLVHETKRAAAIRAKAPAWYHPALGVVFLLIFAGLEREDGALFTAFAMCLLAVAVSQHQAKTGTWQNGLTAGGTRTRWLMALMLAVILGSLALGMWLKYHQGVDGAMIGIGVVMAVFVTWSGYAWERAFLRDAEEGL